MEIYYFLSGLQLAVIAVLLYQYRYMLASIKSNINNIKSIKDGYDVLTDNQSKILKQLTSDNYDVAVNAGNKVDSLAEKTIELDKSVTSIANNLSNLRKETKDSFKQVDINIETIFKTTADNRQY